MANADYQIDYSAVQGQSSALSGHLDDLASALKEMKGIEESMLSSAEWQAENKQEFTSAFEAYLQGGNKLHETGVSQQQDLDKMMSRYHQAESR